MTSTPTAKGTAPDIGEYQSQLWRAADTLRGNIDAAEYKHVVLPLIFLKYISDAFEELHEELESKAEEGMDPEEPDYYTANNVFWVPKEARWSTIQSQARQQTNGATIDQAMTAIERDNPVLRGVLPKDYGRDALDKQRLGEVIDLVSNIKVGGADAQATDVLGRVYEYFLEQFAMAGGPEGWRILHPPLGGPASGGNDRALPGPGLRPMLRFRRNVHPVHQVHRSPRNRERQRGKGQEQPVDLRPGIKPDHLAPRQDEPGHPGHRRTGRVR